MQALQNIIDTIGVVLIAAMMLCFWLVTVALAVLVLPLAFVGAVVVGLVTGVVGALLPKEER
ncbi:hypothetical protein DFLDMN_001506 [Cupriavidus sp. H19C3]|uniref:hypothetical protein n=1 Tax=Cupriavidus sp. H19C3 TaxID=3241603 RepID=UPI003BF78133